MKRTDRRSTKKEGKRLKRPGFPSMHAPLFYGILLINEPVRVMLINAAEHQPRDHAGHKQDRGDQHDPDRGPCYVDIITQILWAVCIFERFFPENAAHAPVSFLLTGGLLPGQCITTCPDSTISSFARSVEPYRFCGKLCVNTGMWICGEQAEAGSGLGKGLL